jgi:SAM-dependent methyltransferase
MVKDLYVCCNCGLVSSSLRADPSIYDQDYYQKYQRYAGTNLGRDIVSQRADLVQSYLSKGKVFDFGCGAGNFFHEMVARGYEATGFDINQASGFCEVERVFKEYDALTAWDSIEHLNNPLELLKGIKAEYVFLCTPNLDNCEEVLAWKHYRPREHIHYFKESSLRALLDAAGYRTLAVTFEESKLRIDGERNIITIVGKRKGLKNGSDQGRTV